jgi:radical SAM superfamily enzyme YgiQ (UPF0313 family)
LSTLLLINPVNSVNIFSYLNPKKAKSNGVAFVPPIGLGYIAAVTPPNWEVKLIDESIEPFHFQQADLVGITATTGQAPRAYEIARIYREKHIPVVMGGIHVSFCREEATRYVDAIVTGEAEEIWPNVIEDFQKGDMKQEYSGGKVDLAVDIVPRRDFFSDRYRVGSIMTSRGCPFACDFCTVTIFNGAKLRRRPVRNVVDELESIPQKLVLFLDDNLLGHSKQDKEDTKELFSEIIRRNIKKRWVAQTSINALDDEEVLHLAREAGCMGFFVGIESVNEDVLERMDKKANLKRGIEFYKECIRKTHKAGMVIMGNFVLGYEKDIEEIDQDTYWMRKSAIDIVNFAILTPYPGTKVFDRIRKENRIMLDRYPSDWGFYDADHPVSRMDYLTLEDMYAGIEHRIKRIYSIPSIVARFIRSLFATRSLYNSLLALFVNLFWVRRKNIARLAILKMLMERND